MITGNYENLKINDKEVATKEYVDNLNTYSTTEMVIGKWIDGRTLYRKVFTVTMPNSTAWSNIISLNYTNYYVVNIHGIMTDGVNTYIVPYSFEFIPD